MSEHAAVVGERLSSEYRRSTDPRTGATIHQFTTAPCINHPPYFLTSALTPDERYLLFTSYRTGAPQLYEIELLEGPIRQLTGVSGLHPYSAVITADGAEVLYTRRDETGGGVIEALRRDDPTCRLVCRLPGAQLGECSVSADGTGWSRP